MNDGANVQIVQECFARFSERDAEGFLELVSPDVEWQPANVVLEGDGIPYVGHAGVRSWLSEVAA